MSEAIVGKKSEVESFNEYLAVEKALKVYMDGAKTGDGNSVRTVFRDRAIVVGSNDGEFVEIDADTFKDLVNEVGGSPEVKARISWIDISGPAAAARVEFLNWSGFRYTDFFLLYKEGNEWKISSKAYDSHTRN